MKKIFYICFLFSVISYQLSVINPVYALSWQDYFPPVKLEESMRQPPGTAIAPEVVGDLDAYSNTLDKQLRCVKMVKLANTWEPKQATVGTDQNGNPIKDFVAQDARNLEKSETFEHYSNNGPRDFQSLFAKGEVKCDTESVQDSFKDMNISGMGAFTRINSISNLDIERSRYFMDVVESLKSPEQMPKDVVAQDVQIAWDCNGTCTELSKKPQNCRPITVSELLYGLRDQPLYYSDDRTQAPTTFPPDAISFITSYYPGSYLQRFKVKSFTKLPLENYLSMYYQLNAPKGNVNNRIKVTNFDGYDTAKQEPILPVVTSVQRPLFAAVAAAAPQAKTFNLTSSVNAVDLPNSTDHDYCRSYDINTTVSIDQPPIVTIMLWVKGLFKHLAPGEKYRHEEGIELVVRNDAGLVENTRQLERNLLQFIPASNIEENKYLEESFTSVAESNADYGVVDPLNRGSKIYEKSYVNFLRPASWQNL